MPGALVGTVLVVDDEPNLRRLARKILTKGGHRVLLAEGGEEAVELFRQHADEIDLVLLDLNMPSMSGEETFAELHAMRKEVRVVLCSGHENAEAPFDLESDGLFDYLRKPYVALRLLEVVDRALLEGR